MRLSRLLLVPWLLLAGAAAGAEADSVTSLEFDDAPLAEPLEHPAWFKDSFLDLRHDLEEAVAAGKRGIVVYFGQRRCPYCKMLLQNNFGLADIETYVRGHFDVVPIDIWGLREVTDLEGRVLTERDYSLREGTNFTPSLLFYDAKGTLALRLRGYYPPYTLRAALEYVADGHYEREAFNAYLARGDSTLRFEPGDLIEEPFFIPPPQDLDRSQVRGERPLLVFFERGDCHACDVLHTQLVRDRAIRDLFYRFDLFRLVRFLDFFGFLGFRGF